MTTDEGIVTCGLPVLRRHTPFDPKTLRVEAEGAQGAHPDLIARLEGRWSSRAKSDGSDSI